VFLLTSASSARSINDTQSERKTISPIFDVKAERCAIKEGPPIEKEEGNKTCESRSAFPGREACALLRLPPHAVKR
jgi:hypothetical protein